MKLRLPYPPSVNHYWRHLPTGRGRMSVIIGEEGQRFRGAVWIEARRRRLAMIEGPVAIDIVVTRPDLRRRDFDNIEKATFDALVFAKLIEDDSLVLDKRTRDSYVIERDGAIDITIEPMEVREWEDRR
ncbi:MAG TPA: RusA family crossover junction endodeoxyribonuclease [Anaeromyxobacteraceae bacterium]|nr:RusA family crossover junction endodeoxyribonuclease [Anaeromyxobacteraceae bacterium]